MFGVFAGIILLYLYVIGSEVCLLVACVRLCVCCCDRSHATWVLGSEDIFGECPRARKFGVNLEAPRKHAIGIKHRHKHWHTSSKLT